MDKRDGPVFETRKLPTYAVFPQILSHLYLLPVSFSLSLVEKETHSQIL